MSPGSDTLPASTGTRIQYWRSFAGGPGMVSRCQLESWNYGAATADHLRHASARYRSMALSTAPK